MLPATAFTPEGFLKDLSAWTPAVAEQLAAAEGIALTTAHWEVLHLLRDYYQQFDSSPAMRPLVKWVRINLGEDCGRSVYLLSLFPGSPAKIASKIAGLPKPDNCL
ncbi:MAG TPA: TusE/DsrC/DsvC family sulfur relay protein [Halieaceae bacterium]|jgi:tRNA 2-thiouridine synthesizing protein E|uniref:Sulfurtransferase n=1 Tax=Haliea salexigens TaxID=287487 RepID=A0A3C1KJ03_9GAMM|nr:MULTISPECIES: TusE/DsrC/DsvC family sulfur relay protein [Haliea]HAN26642.1 TusE/DsrC/DsvC family sulfur relay protein [Haliea salexigens]HAN69522.1 TusE/DsrC/DsvC family sulfur relay protein [Halieaceae bacterium]MAD62750.1 sulfurtransferase TusE [Haliea sp.]MAD62990.1 sulfurtransferase TusE [Haliea sp.]MAY91622.1 sulfurtransferase TusE [Haliea sp.]|tara:strand:+ start:24085 stop:24402 length:318 start_codon:yes stop_codon:yes gene_type:complete